MFCISLLLLICIASYSQSIEYTYDANGNRLTRTVITLKSGLINGEVPPIKDELSDFSLLLYPNPTQGEIKLEVKGCDKDALFVIELFTIDGNFIRNLRFKGPGIHQLDLNSLADGVYLLNLIYNNQKSHYKIIKT